MRYALLFRDYLTRTPRPPALGPVQDQAGAKRTDLADYGQIKAPAQEILMESALRRARDQGWRPQPS